MFEVSIRFLSHGQRMPIKPAGSTPNATPTGLKQVTSSNGSIFMFVSLFSRVHSVFPSAIKYRSPDPVVNLIEKKVESFALCTLSFVHAECTVKSLHAYNPLVWL